MAAGAAFRHGELWTKLFSLTRHEQFRPMISRVGDDAVVRRGQGMKTHLSFTQRRNVAPAVDSASGQGAGQQTADTIETVICPGMLPAYELLSSIRETSALQEAPTGIVQRPVTFRSEPSP